MDCFNNRYPTLLGCQTTSELVNQPYGMAHATIFDDSGEWWATKLAPAVVEQ